MSAPLYAESAEAFYVECNECQGRGTFPIYDGRRFACSPCDGTGMLAVSKAALAEANDD